MPSVYNQSPPIISTQIEPVEFYSPSYAFKFFYYCYKAERTRDNEELLQYFYIYDLTTLIISNTFVSMPLETFLRINGPNDLYHKLCDTGIFKFIEDIDKDNYVSSEGLEIIISNIFNKISFDDIFEIKKLITIIAIKNNIIFSNYTAVPAEKILEYINFKTNENRKYKNAALQLKQDFEKNYVEQHSIQNLSQKEISIIKNALQIAYGSEESSFKNKTNLEKIFLLEIDKIKRELLFIDYSILQELISVIKNAEIAEEVRNKIFHKLYINEAIDIINNSDGLTIHELMDIKFAINNESAENTVSSQIYCHLGKLKTIFSHYDPEHEPEIIVYNLIKFCDIESHKENLIKFIAMSNIFCKQIIIDKLNKLFALKPIAKAENNFPEYQIASEGINIDILTLKDLFYIRNAIHNDPQIINSFEIVLYEENIKILNHIILNYPSLYKKIIKVLQDNNLYSVGIIQHIYDNKLTKSDVDFLQNLLHKIEDTEDNNLYKLKSCEDWQRHKMSIQEKKYLLCLIKQESDLQKSHIIKKINPYFIIYFLQKATTKYKIKLQQMQAQYKLITAKKNNNVNKEIVLYYFDDYNDMILNINGAISFINKFLLFNNDVESEIMNYANNFKDIMHFSCDLCSAAIQTLLVNKDEDIENKVINTIIKITLFFSLYYQLLYLSSYAALKQECIDAANKIKFTTNFSYLYTKIIDVLLKAISFKLHRYRKSVKQKQRFLKFINYIMENISLIDVVKRKLMSTICFTFYKRSSLHTKLLNELAQEVLQFYSANSQYQLAIDENIRVNIGMLNKLLADNNIHVIYLGKVQKNILIKYIKSSLEIKEKYRQIYFILKNFTIPEEDRFFAEFDKKMNSNESLVFLEEKFSEIDLLLFILIAKSQLKQMHDYYDDQSNVAKSKNKKNNKCKQDENDSAGIFEPNSKKIIDSLEEFTEKFRKFFINDADSFTNTQTIQTQIAYKRKKMKI